MYTYMLEGIIREHGEGGESEFSRRNGHDIFYKRRMAIRWIYELKNGAGRPNWERESIMYDLSAAYFTGFLFRPVVGCPFEVESILHVLRFL